MADKGKRNAGKKSTVLNIADSTVYETIRQRAYELYCTRGQTQGSDIQDWLEAEKQVKKELRQSR